MKLYYAPGACSLSPHIVLRESERHFDLERVDLATHRTASGADYRQVNPSGYVPALDLGGGEVLTEGPAIVQYIADLVPERRLAPPNGTFARYHLQSWLNFISAELHKQFAPMFTPESSEADKAKARGKIGERLAYVQTVLADRGFLMGETFTVADAYLFVMLQWCSGHDIDLQMYPNIDDYEYRVAHRPAVQAAMLAEGLVDRAALKRSA
ncbi:MAG: glutathione transferase GstA [Kofleriaceae bacterium]